MVNNTLAVVSQSGETITFYNASTGDKTGHLTGLIAEPHELAYDERTNLLYVSHAYGHGMFNDHGPYAHSISIIDCERRQVVDAIDVSPAGGPHGLALDLEHDILYASVEDGLDGPEKGGIIGIDLKTRKVVKSIASGYRSHWFVMTPDGKKAFTCNKHEDCISIIDLFQERKIGEIPLVGGCEQPAISKDGKHIFLPCPALPFGKLEQPKDPCVKVVDTATDEVVATTPMDLGAVTIHVDSKDRLLVGQYRFDTSGGRPIPLNGQLVVYSSKEDGLKKLGSVEVDKVPLTVVSSPDGRRGFASNIFSGTVTVVDMDTLSVERTLDVDTERRQDKKFNQGAHGLALIP